MGPFVTRIKSFARLSKTLLGAHVRTFEIVQSSQTTHFNLTNFSVMPGVVDDTKLVTEEMISLDINESPESLPTPAVHDGSQLPTEFSGRARRPRPPRAVRDWRKEGKMLGEGDLLGEGDSYLVLNILPDDLAEVAFERMKEEIKWNKMRHRGGEVPRLVAVEGQLGEDGSFPVYRHPADESPPLSAWSPTVEVIRKHVQQVLGQAVNHVLIQLYRTGKDAISEHSDKTIDVVRGSNIVNVSLGAQRVMTLKSKKDWPKLSASQVSDRPQASTSGTPSPISAAKESGAALIVEVAHPAAIIGSEAEDGHGSEMPTLPRQTQRIPLPHNSMFVMGPETNRRWLHGINPDNRPVKTKSEEERFQNGERISLTFRHIGTFLSNDEKFIWGQGATGKTRETAKDVVNGSQGDSERLIEAFGMENHRSDFDWDETYGEGSNVLHFASNL